MSEKLELVRERKLFELIPGKKPDSRLEASGVAPVDDSTAAVIFDNLDLVARIDLSLERKESNRMVPAPSLTEGFEDYAGISYRNKRRPDCGLVKWMRRRGSLSMAA